MIKAKDSHTGTDVARINKVFSGSLPLQQPVPCKIRHRKTMNIDEWNDSTLIHKTRYQRPEGNIALTAKELDRYNVDIAVSGETRLSGYDSMVDYGYTFCSVRSHWNNDITTLAITSIVKMG
ncbi:Hypothetical predicted protein [Octopus vulgaris]|uniref:Uncharacterized protein n=1 Tax=Octopus vulgaris TaxID=6645 RepID=A0AA36F711_OCTVU|nr:Hypothetical predicted protein [Octopus vulgaris]